MKRFSTGLIIGLVTGLIVATATFALAANPIKLIVNGQEIQCDVPPQNINGRVLVPARFVAESLGASVTWDAANNAVVITSVTPLAVEEKNVSSPTVEAGEQEVKETTFKGLKAIEVDGKIYFSGIDYSRKYEKGPGTPYSPGYGIDKGANMLTYSDSNGQTTPIATINEDSIQIYSHFSYINVKYYREP